MKEIIENQSNDKMGNIQMFMDDCLYSLISNGRPLSTTFTITTASRLFKDTNKEQVMSVLEKESIVIKLSDPAQGTIQGNVPKKADLNGLFMLDKDRLFN